MMWKKKKNNLLNIEIEINNINEILSMLYEEKYTTKAQLINIISCKETLDSLINYNHYIFKSYIQNKEDETVNSIYLKNKWDKMISLYLYEISALDLDKLSNDLIEVFQDLFFIRQNNDIGKNIKKIIIDEFNIFLDGKNFLY